jgi:hypothetical protein
MKQDITCRPHAEDANSQAWPCMEKKLRMWKSFTERGRHSTLYRLDLRETGLAVW